MFIKLRNRIKRYHSAPEKKSGKGGSQSSIFRRAKQSSSNAQLLVEPALTWSLSNDEAAEGQSDHTPSPQVQKISSYIFSEQDLMNNELTHMRQLAEKQQEIAKLQQVHVELAQLLASKDETIEGMQQELDFKDSELKEVYEELSDKDAELVETRLELVEAKKELNVVSAVLMKCQADLHEQVSKVWPWLIR